MKTGEYFQMGAQRYEHGNYDGAIANFDEAIQLDSNNVGVFTIRGAAWGQNKALCINPNNQHALHNYSFVLALKNHVEEA